MYVLTSFLIYGFSAPVCQCDNKFCLRRKWKLLKSHCRLT